MSATEATRALIHTVTSECGELEAPQEGLLVWNLPADPAIPSGDVVTWNRCLVQGWRDLGRRPQSELSEEERYRTVWLLPDRQKERQLFEVAEAIHRLEDGGQLVLTLPNDWGAKRLQKRLGEWLEGELGSASKHHSRVIWWTKQPGRWKEEEVEKARKAGALQRLPDLDRWSRPGIFSWDRVDIGSALLARNLPDDLQGEVADLGGGWGYLGCEVLSRCEDLESLDVFESDGRALEAARRNMGNVLVPVRPKIHWVDVTEGVGVRRFDAVVMNPPFHEGRDADSTLGLRFIAAAAAALRDEGQLWMVANRHLPYEALLSELFYEFRMVEDSHGFKVLHAVAPTPLSRPKTPFHRGRKKGGPSKRRKGRR